MFGTVPSNVPAPEILIATPAQMRIMQCGKILNCTPTPVANERINGKFTIFVVNDIQSKGREGASWVVHHFVHHIQLYVGFKGDMEKFSNPTYRKILEEQATTLQKLYLSLISV